METRTEPDKNASEMPMLGQYLTGQREIVLWKTKGLTKAQMAQTTATSDLTLAGLLYHLALVEESWFEVRFAGLPERPPWVGVDWEGDPDWEFRTGTELEPDAVRQRYQEACQRSQKIIDQASGPEQTSVTANKRGEHFTLRWVMLHMIEETARHAGHIDLIRQAIDGLTGE